MRLALISDIHGNLSAVEAVIDDLRAFGPDQVISLGDVAAIGAQPHQTLALLRRQTNWSFVLGNTDAFLLDPQPSPAPDEYSRRLQDVEAWGASQLDEENLSFLRSFRPRLEITLDSGQTLLCYHGSPRSYDDPIFPATPDADLDRFFSAPAAGFLAGGHTHTAMLRPYHSSRLINPGSAGLAFKASPGRPRDKVNLPVAEYAWLEEIAGQVQITFRRLRYDFGPVRRAALASGMPHVDWWLSLWEESPSPTA